MTEGTRTVRTRLGRAEIHVFSKQWAAVEVFSRRGKLLQHEKELIEDRVERLTGLLARAGIADPEATRLATELLEEQRRYSSAPKSGTVYRLLRRIGILRF